MTVQAQIFDENEQVDEDRLGSLDAAVQRHNDLYLQDVTDAWAIVAPWVKKGPVVLGAGEDYDGFLVPPLWNLKGRPSAMALSFQAVVDVLDNPDRFSAGLYETQGGRTFTHMDGEEHRRYRILLLQVFSPRAIKRWEREIVVPTVEDLLARFGSTQRLDLIPTLFRWVSPIVFAKLCGLPLDQIDTFSAWTMWQFFPHDPTGRAGAMRLNAFLREQVAKVRALPPAELEARSDLISTMIRAESDGDRLSDDEIVAAVQIMIIGGTDTVGRTMSAIAYYMFTEPGVLQRVQSDRSLLAAVVEETLRLAPPNTIQGRLTTQDCEFHGVQLKAGMPIMINSYTGNRDPAIWKDPHKFDIDRPKSRHLSWGTGAHACVGLHLARADIMASFNGLLDRFPNIRLDDQAPRPMLRGFGFRAPLAVNVQLD